MAFDKETQEFKTGTQVNYGWNLTWEATGKFPIIAKRAFKKLADAQAYVDDPTQTACEGLILAVFNDVEKNNGIYLVQSVGTSTAAGVLVKAGSGTGSITAENYTAAKALATADNIGQLIFVLNEETSTTEKVPGSETEFVKYSAGPYVVTGAGSIAKLGTTSASGDLAGDVETLKGNVSTLQGAVKDLEDAVDGIAYPVTDVQIDGNSILEGTIANLNNIIDTAYDSETTSGNALSHKAIAAKFKAVEELISNLPKFSIEVVDTLPTKDISNTVIYLVKPTPESAEEGNLYEEFIYVNSAWEKLGTQKLDLSGYYTSDQVDDAIETALSDYVKKNGTDRLITETEATQIQTNKSSIDTLNDTTIPGITDRLDDAEGRLDDIEADLPNTVTNANSTDTTVLNASTSNRLITLTPVVGEFGDNHDADIKKDGIAKVSDVKEFVKNSIDSAFAWVDVEEETEE